MRTDKIITSLLLLIFLTLPVLATAGSLDSSGVPAVGSGMPTTTDIFNRLDTGAASSVPGSFQEPVAGPTAGSGRSLAEVQNKLPAADDLNGADVGDVAKGKTFWGLRTDGTWGLQTGAMNSTPMSNAGADQNVATGSSVILDGSTSSDADSNPLTYLWAFTSVPGGSNASLNDTTVAQPTFVADLDGNYVLSLIVDDGLAVSIADSVTVTATSPVSTVTSLTGRVWMDRNLGASQVATSFDDAAAYGDLYQWGRGADGHERRTSSTTTTLSSSDTPGHGIFILAPSSPCDWRTLQNDSLWQGVSGVNNPCPSGFRLPTITEWEAELATWSIDNRDGAFASPLRLGSAGVRSVFDGSLGYAGSDGYYWSSSVDGGYVRYLSFRSGSVNVSYSYRASGFSARCIED